MNGYKYPVCFSDCLSTIMPAIQKRTNVDAEAVETYANRAYMCICKYLNCDELPGGLETAVEALTVSYIRLDTMAANGVVTQQTQGSRSASYSYGNFDSIDADGLTTSVKAMLPLPKLRYITL